MAKLELFTLLLSLPFVALPLSAQSKVQSKVAERQDQCGFIREAIRALPLAGGEVSIPQGLYECASPLVLDRDNVSLRGAGRVVLRLANDSNAPLIIMGQIKTPPGNVQNIAVSDLELDGNMDHQQIECWGGPCDSGGTSFIRNNGITVRGVTNGSIRNVDIRRARSGGVVTEKGCYGLEIDGLHSTENFFDGFAGYETYGSKLKNMMLLNNRAAGISIDIHFDGNQIERTTIRGNGDVGIFMRDSDANKFTDVRIENSGNHGIFLAQVDDASTCANGNEFSNLKVFGSVGVGFRLNDACTGNLLTGTAEFRKNRDGCISEGSDVPLGVQGSVVCEE